jgi:hypothetical protein
MTGYSSKNLIDKLGIKPNSRVIVMRAPTGYMDLLPDLEDYASVSKRLTGRFDFILFFATSVEQLGAVIPNLSLHLEPGAMLWVCWAKRTSPRHTGLDDTIVRKSGISAGLVDVKVAAINEDWSGLKFVYRVADR